MNHRPLLLDPTLSMEKRAYDTRIDDNVEEWPVAVVRESYKQLPFLKSYETEVELDKVDSARGYGVGKLLVWPARMEKGAAAQNRQLITLPVIIRNRELSPMDVYTHQGRMQPMDQTKVAEALFTPNVFERAAPHGQFEGTNMQDQLAPPNSDHQFMPGSVKSAGVNVLQAVQHTFRQEDIEDFAVKLASDHGLRFAMTQTPVLRQALEGLARVVEKTAADIRGERISHLKPTVVQFRESGNGYICKTANHHCYNPQERRCSRFEAQAALTKEAYAQLLATGVVTRTTTPEVAEPLSVKVAGVVTRVGRYQVSSGGRMVEGIAIPKVVDFEGRDLGHQVFVTDDAHAFQEKIAGVFLEHHLLSSDTPQGVGVFVYQEGQQAVAYEPVRVNHVVKTAGASYLACTRMADGSSIRVSLVPGLQKVASIGNEISLPSAVSFVALPGRRAIGVSSDSRSFDTIVQEKTAGASSVKLVSDGNCFSLRGANADAAFKNEIMEADATAFALGALGLTGAQAADLMKTAAKKGEAIATRTHRVVPADLRMADTLMKTASALENTPALRVDLSKELALLTAPKAQVLWKQASVILSRETADTILSLGFVTPENASLYCNYIPELEKVSSKLAELLVASRLGMDDVREAAAKNAMTQVDAVVRGLESLRQRIN